MNAISAEADLPGRALGPPGSYFRRREPTVGPVPALMSAVPAFVGFSEHEMNGRARPDQQARVLTRWDPDLFGQWIAPADESFLPMVVHGFFANGGKQCVVITVPKQSGAEGMRIIFSDGGALEDRSDFDLLCVPDAVSVLVDDANGYQVQLAALRHCERMGDRFAILDAGRASQARGPALLEDMPNVAARLRSTCGAIYFPWIAAGRPRDFPATVQDPRSIQWRRRPRGPSANDHRPHSYGPACGHVAGLYARTEALIGPQQAPANAALENVVDVSINLDDQQHALLNDAGVNCLRSRRGGGIEVGGARTLINHGSLAYVSSARVYLGFKRWLAIGMRDLVFEPNNELLRQRVRRRLESRCRFLLAAGALAGATAADAFFVKCDDETNGPGAAELGLIVADVGLALSVPTEYIVIRVEHDPGGSGPGSLS